MCVVASHKLLQLFSKYHALKVLHPVSLFFSVFLFHSLFVFHFLEVLLPSVFSELAGMMSESCH
jgi:hypothetical protein